MYFQDISHLIEFQRIFYPNVFSTAYIWHWNRPKHLILSISYLQLKSERNYDAGLSIIMGPSWDDKTTHLFYATHHTSKQSPKTQEDGGIFLWNTLRNPGPPKWGIFLCPGGWHLYSHPLYCRRPAHSAGSKSDFDFLVEWNTILLTPVNRWLYDCLSFSLSKSGVNYDPRSSPQIFMTQKALLSQGVVDPKTLLSCTSSMSNQEGVPCSK